VEDIADKTLPERLSGVLTAIAIIDPLGID